MRHVPPRRLQPWTHRGSRGASSIHPPGESCVGPAYPYGWKQQHVEWVANANNRAALNQPALSVLVELCASRSPANAWNVLRCASFFGVPRVFFYSGTSSAAVTPRLPNLNGVQVFHIRADKGLREFVESHGQIVAFENGHHALNRATRRNLTPTPLVTYPWDHITTTPTSTAAWTALMFGDEGAGLAAPLWGVATAAVEIEMGGSGDQDSVCRSLNIATSAGIALHHAIHHAGLTPTTREACLTPHQHHNTEAMQGVQKTAGVMEAMQGVQRTAGIMETMQGVQRTAGIMEAMQGVQRTAGVMETASAGLVGMVEAPVLESVLQAFPTASEAAGTRGALGAAGEPLEPWVGQNVADKFKGLPGTQIRDFLDAARAGSCVGQRAFLWADHGTAGTRELGTALELLVAILDADG